MAKKRVSFADRLQEARTRAGLDKGELARKAGVHLDTVTKLERGDRQPMLEIARKLAQALGISLDVLAG